MFPHLSRSRIVQWIILFNYTIPDKIFNTHVQFHDAFSCFFDLSDDFWPSQFVLFLLCHDSDRLYLILSIYPFPCEYLSFIFKVYILDKVFDAQISYSVFYCVSKPNLIDRCFSSPDAVNYKLYGLDHYCAVGYIDRKHIWHLDRHFEIGK